MSPLERMKALVAGTSSAPVAAPVAAPAPALSPAEGHAAMRAVVAHGLGVEMLSRVAAAVAAPNPGVGNPYVASARSDIPGTDPIVIAPAPVVPTINPPRRSPGRPANKTIPMAPSAAVREAAATMPEPIPADPAPAGPELAASLARPAAPTVTAAVPPARLDADRTAQPKTAITAEAPQPGMPLVNPTHVEGASRTALSTPPPAAVAPTLPSPGPSPIPAPAVKPIETLCVGCAPVGHAFETLDSILMQVREMIGLPAYYQGFGYKTNGLVSEGTMRIINSGGRREVLVVHDPHAPEAALVLPFLRASAQVVVECLR